MSTPLTFSHHAVIRMAERGISNDEVIAAIEDPDRMRAQDDGTVTLWKATRSGEVRVTLNAVYDIVVTVCWSPASECGK